MKCDISDVHNWLIGQGFKRYHDGLYKQRVYGRDRAGGDDCDCNGISPQILVELYPREEAKDFEGSAQVGIVAEKNNLWCDFKVYSLSFDELIDNYDKIKMSLSKIWEVYCEEI